MEILSLKIQNFLTIGKEANLRLDNQGLVLIQGVNEDDSSATSNGAGKSTIVDALCWALFDETAREESGDSIVNDQAKKDCFVSVLLKDGETTYRITRYRKHKVFKNQTTVHVYKSDDLTMATDISKGTEKETQELVNEIIGCSKSVFVSAIYAGQENTPDLPRMTDKQLKMLIEEASGVERLEQAYNIAKSEALAIQNEINSVGIKRGTLLSSIDDNKSRLEKAKAEHKLFEDGREVRAGANKRLAMTFIEQVRGMQEELAKKQPEELKTRLLGLSEQVNGIKAKQDELKKQTDIFNAKNTSISNQKFILKGMLEQINSLKFTYENAETEMAKPCVECGKPHDASELVEFKKHTLEKIQAQAEIAKQTQAKIVELEESRNTFALGLEALEREISELNHAEVFRISSEINGELAAIDGMKITIESHKKEASNAAEKAKSSMTEPNPQDAIIAHFNKVIEEGESALEKLNDNLIELERQNEIASGVVKVFSPAGVRAHILDTVTPFLNDRTADYLSVLSDGNVTAIWTTVSTTAKGEIREKFNIEVSNDKGGKSFKLLSGGEKRKVRLATMLALQDLVASRATKPINLWIGDEIDDAVDPAGLERLMGILERKAREKGTVLVISHNELSDWVDNSVTVTKRGGYSSIEGSIC